MPETRRSKPRSRDRSAHSKKDAKDDGGRAVVKAAFLAAAAAAEVVVTLTVIGSQPRVGYAAVVGIVVIGTIFTASMVIAAIYVKRDR